MKRIAARRARQAPPRRRALAGARRTGTSRRLAAAGPGARTPRKRDRTGAIAAVALALVVLAWVLWPAPPRPEPAPPVPPPVQKAATSREPRKVVPRRPAPAPKAAEPDLDEARVRAAVLARAPTLRACPVPAGAPSQVPVRLHVPSSGEVRSVQFAGVEPLPPPLSACLREKLLLWRFDDLHLSSDVDLFATFALR